MITEGCPYFLSRPRRFGKSLLVNTLAAVFEGRRELFEAFTTKQGIEQPQLFIARSDWKWEKYPVLRFDFSAGDMSTIKQLDSLIDDTLSDYEEEYGIKPRKRSEFNLRMKKLIHTAEKQTGKKVVVLVDEYDNMMLHSLGDAEKQKTVRERFQHLFGPLKSEDGHLQFVFITGISKFSQMGIFSKLNNLNNISMVPAYETICGITEEELVTTLRPDIELMAGRQGKSYDAILAELKANYDGYHFSEGKTDIYNPFSLFKAFNNDKVNSYWFESGTTQALIDMLAQMPPIDMAEVEGIRLPSTAFDLPFETLDDPLPILYQSGYLTIKDCKNYDFDIIYTLDFPNAEVRRGFADCLFKHVAGKKMNSRQSSALQLAYYDFRDDGDLPAFIEALKVFFAGVLAPPKLGGYRGLNKRNTDAGSDPQPPNLGGFDAMLYTLFVSFGADVVAEDLSSQGRADITLKMPRGIYVMELKYNDTADAALEQISRKGYADKYALDGRPVTKVGIAFSSEERNISDWRSEPKA
ncbi:MAG: ATP-binding protein [Prevotella sp.]|nr:ATP-binding protein [Prevotella sp.]